MKLKPKAREYLLKKESKNHLDFLCVFQLNKEANI